MVGFRVLYSDLGGDKEDYGGPPENTATDRADYEVNTAFVTTANMSRVSLLGKVNFSLSSSPILTTWETQWKGKTQTLPVLANISVGSFTITFQSTVVDDRNNSQTINFVNAYGNLSVPGSVVCSCLANVITVNVYTITGTLYNFDSLIVCSVRFE